MRILPALFLIFLSGCTGFLFQPMRAHVLDPQKLGITVKDVYFETSDKLQLHGWLLPAKTRKAAGTILFLHGNAENISTHIGSIYWLPEFGFNVFIFDYRGYGSSQGVPTLPGLRADFHAALDTLIHMDGIDPDRIVVFGQSLGAAVAITALSESPHRTRVRALVVEGAPSSFRSVAQEMLGKWWATWLFQWPLALTIDDSDRPIDRIAAISPTPVLIVHSHKDQVIPFHHGQDLYESARAPREFWAADDAPHIAVFTTPGWRKRLVEYLGRAVSGTPDQSLEKSR